MIFRNTSRLSVIFQKMRYVGAKRVFLCDIGMVQPPPCKLDAIQLNSLQVVKFDVRSFVPGILADIMYGLKNVVLENECIVL